MNNIQDETVLINAVVDAVRERGYLGWYSSYELSTRQIVKAVEELGELAELAVMPDVAWWKRLWFWAFKLVARWSRRVFDAGYCGELHVSGDAHKELADLTVVLCVLAYSLEFQESRDARLQPKLLQPALDKARGDVKRGVRSGK